MIEYLNGLYPINDTIHSLVFTSFQNFNAISIPSFSTLLCMKLNQTPKNNNTGKEHIEGILNKAKGKIRIFYCPRCGLRKPAVEILGYYGGHCPSCGCRMVEEASLPYTSKKSRHIV